MTLFKSKWTKWELIEEGKPMVMETYNPLFPGFYDKKTNVIVDVYKRLNTKTGIYQYKNVQR